MNESERIADQLHRAFFGGAWHGPALKELLAGVTEEAADRRPIASGHSIREIVDHLHAWITEADATARGKQYETLEGDRDWPAGNSWTDALAALERAEESLEEVVRALPPDRLGEGERSLYYLLHGIVQHNLYHAGQIALLKKG